jgi:hypothetical protein
MPTACTKLSTWNHVLSSFLPPPFSLPIASSCWCNEMRSYCLVALLGLASIVPSTHATCFSCVTPPSNPGGTAGNYIYDCSQSLRHSTGPLGELCSCDSGSFSYPGQTYNTCAKKVRQSVLCQCSRGLCLILQPSRIGCFANGYYPDPGTYSIINGCGAITTTHED